ncbi:putative fatty acyl-CoA reductase CG8306 [Anabrus simplex]|uniref:putative fatty acyl-CoA reductase CG8306 n=1 Tax=Anabrus simplex TaxID=316456 RepID=UPI0035A35FDD
MGDGDKASSVADFYKNANVFLTGGTGFVGMALIEKLLRCTEVSHIYMLIRAKKDKSPTQRLQDLAKDPLYEKLTEERGADIFSKVVGVSGNVEDEGLGLSPEDRQMLKDNVHIVIHSAATLDFEAPLKPTVVTNLQGTRRVLELAKEIPHLKALVHVSSAYVNSNLRDVDEILYPVKEDPDKLIDLCNTLTVEALDALTPKLLGDLPNAYVLTKALAEHEVSKVADRIPAAIVRPSMITSAWKEPIPGWTNSKNGPTGFMMGASKGVVRRLPVKSDLIYDYIPVDMVVNEILVAAWHVASKRSPAVSVFHCTSSTCNPFRWSSIENHLNTYLHKYPLKSAVWYPYVKFVPSLLMFRISAIFVHFIPAYILDTVMRLTGGRPILVRLHTNVNRSLGKLAPFIFNEWHFDNKNTQSLNKQLSEEDRKMFSFDISTLDWPIYFVNLSQGVRCYLNKEHPRTLPAALRKDKILLVLHVVTQALIFSLIWWLVAVCLGTTMTRSSWVPLVSYFLFSLL